ncbi:unnamed protein product [Penicillium glandicola]
MEHYPDGAIAVVGMACRFPGANSVDEFWEILKTGRSLDRDLPDERIHLAGHWRNPAGMTMKGNFLDDVDAFDHKFFKITRREAATMDPQQRLLLEVSYQALESSGYFGHSDWDPHVGCYIGGFSSDYNDNIASQPANAYSALGSLKGFQSGRVSHHFRWTGPSIMYDTVCSSSGVAIDAACKAIIAGDCSSAIAGGVSVFTSPFFYQNLAGASFLSPEGRIKPFDSKADGYSRGEGVGMVVLKPLSAAISAGDPMLGIIRSSMVRQSSSSHITVPHSESQAILYRQVLSRAQVSPDKVTYIEAHGTGTRIGDFPEYEGIKGVFGGEKRKDILYFASLKGNIGHAEGASGVASLIKTLLMTQHSQIPPQANFNNLNPRINLYGEKIGIPLILQPWNAEPRVALVSNFGAAGSMSAMIVQEPPPPDTPLSSSKCTTFPELSYQLQQAPSVDRKSEEVTSDRAPKPVVLVFGGQASRQIHFPVDIYQSSSIFAFHLDECNKILTNLGIPNVASHILHGHECNDAMTLQTMQFVAQYSCARTWIDCGLRVDCILGHSLGQLVALVVSGCLSLADGLQFVCARASLIDNKWGEDKGVMTSLKCNFETVQSIMCRANQMEPSYQLEIACHNGPKSHVLVGTTQESQALQSILKEEFPDVQYKRLDVTHGFHSKLTEPILKDLHMLASSLTFNNQSIPIEMSSETPTQGILTAASLVEHTRQSVYFGNAVQRIEDRLGPCTWIEAGAGSSVIDMTRSASNQRKAHVHDFIPVELDEASKSSIANTITKLWVQGHGVSFWPFGPSRTPNFRILQIPPYQFDQPRHWVQWKDKMVGSGDQKNLRSNEIETEAPAILTCLHGPTISASENLYLLNTESPQWRTLVKGHRIQNTPVCPASLYLALIIQAVRSFPESTQHNLVPRVDGFQMRTALGMCENTQVTLKLVRKDKELQWQFFFQRNDASISITAAEGKITLVSEETQSTEFARATRLLNAHPRGQQAENKHQNTLCGPLVYNLLSKIVDLDPIYHRLDGVSLDKRTMRADVLAKSDPSTGDNLSTTLDACLQATPLHLSSFLSLIKSDHTFACVSIDSVQLSTQFMSENLKQSWSLLSHLTASGKTDFKYDVFALDPKAGAVALIMSQVRLSRVPAILISSNASLNSSNQESSQQISTISEWKDSQGYREKSVGASRSSSIEPNNTSDQELRELLSSVTDISTNIILDSTQLLELGVDSLGMSEICTGIREKFSTSVSHVELQSTMTFGELCDLLKSKAVTGQITSGSRHPPPRYEVQSEQTDHSDIESLGTLSQVKQLLREYIDVPDVLDLSSRFKDLGIDSLLCIELAHDINGLSVALNDQEITPETTLHELCSLVHGRPQHHQSTRIESIDKFDSNGKTSRNIAPLENQKVRWRTPPQELVEKNEQCFKTFAAEIGCQRFWQDVYPAQARLLQAYILEAFEKMGFHIRSLKTGERLPEIFVISKYNRLKKVLLDILREGELIDYDGIHYIRSDKTADIPMADELAEKLTHQYPKFALDTQLLQVTGPRLASFLLGQEEPLQYLFANAETKLLLEEVYTNSPMFLIMSKLLANFIQGAGLAFEASRPIRILEIGAGTGGTTSEILKSLIQKNVPFHYAFTDLSPSLVNLGRRKFAKYGNCMEFYVFDVERAPPSEMTASFDIVISTLCIHATRDLTKSLCHVNQVLQPQGFVALAEFTKRIPWLDCVFGLLDGWWLFDDGRTHALAPAPLWEKAMVAGGFKQSISTGDRSLESQTSRIAFGFKSEHEFTTTPKNWPKLIEIEKETVCFDRLRIHLRADIYYPSDVSILPSRQWPVALVIHGGGHVLLSRKDVPARQILWLLDNGILPISIDYRLCPEETFIDGPVSDVCTAFVWARNKLPELNLQHSNIQIDAERIGIVGWSSGGTLALTLGWTPRQLGVRPPDAVLAFYCPCDYEDEYWTTSQAAEPWADEIKIDSKSSLLDGVEEHPITSHGLIYSTRKHIIDCIHPSNARARIYWHMVRNGQTLPVLCNGLPHLSAISVDKAERLKIMEQPSCEDVRKFSPLAHMKDGEYTVPTFFVHGKSDTFIPWQQTKRAYDILREHGVPTGISLPEGEAHLFDMEYDPRGTKWDACEKAYMFLQEHLHR